MNELSGATEDAVQGQASLAPLLHSSMVGWEELDGGYHSLLELVRALLGVVPNCDRYLEIWPPAFRTYNVMVPNLLNLPVPVLGFGGPPPSVVGLAMYVASRTADCPYCSAHSCSFALRRGADPEKVAAALLPDRNWFEPGELAAIAVARSLASVPGELRAADKAALIEAYGEKRAEWIALSVVMMGFLNKFMDAVGVDVEQPLVSEVSDTLGDGWTPGKAGARLDPDSPRLPPPPIDGLRSRLRILPLLPAAIRYDRRAQQGTPRRRSAVARHLAVTTGHDFPVLANLRSSRARRAIATMLKENLDPEASLIGIRTKVLAGAVYAAVVADPHLMADIEALAERAGLTGETLAAAAAFGRREAPAPEAATALQLARDASSSPAAIDTATVDACAKDLTPEAIIEAVTWLSVLQLLHRLTRYVRPTG
ncbi:MAG: carboxymuconolactone decarboxylase family protein [Ilumatobacteraceae bacterium]